ncbi:hypothetical protein M8N35_15485 [Enterobacter roggenkampii]|nr:hypothetical protein [Enterobacter roggenkampii]
MAELTKEWLLTTIAELEEERDATPGVVNVDVAIALAAMKLALASLEAEAVAWLLSGGGAKNNVSFDSGNAYADPLREVTPLYTAPPAPVSVPAAMEMDDDFDSAFEHGKAVGWNACRAAMLQSFGNSEQLNSPVIPGEVLSAVRKVACIRADFDGFDGDRRDIGDCLDEAEQELIVTINKYASVIAAAPQEEVK